MEGATDDGRNKSPEKRSGSKMLVRSFGEAALVLCGYWAGRNLVKQSVPAIHRLLDHLDLTEHEGHPQSVEIFKSLAESFGVDVQEEHVAYWRSMLTVTGALDTIIDRTQPSSLSKEVASLLSGEPIPGISKTDAEEFLAFVVNASDTRHSTIMASLDTDELAHKRYAASDSEEILQEGESLARKINDITENIRIASDPQELATLRREESKIYSRIMMIDNPQQDASIEAFNNYLLELCEAAYLLDSALDLFKDYRSGVTDVKPTPTNYLAIGNEALHATYHSLSQLPKHTVAHLAVASIKKAIRKTLKVQASQEA